MSRALFKRRSARFGGERDKAERPLFLSIGYAVRSKLDY